MIHCVKSVRIRSFSGPYSVRMWEIRTRKTPNTDTFHAVINFIEYQLVRTLSNIYDRTFCENSKRLKGVKYIHKNVPL